MVLQAGASPLYLQYFETTHAVLKGNTWMLQAGGSPLHWAAGGGQVEVVRKLLKANAPMDVIDKVGSPGPQDLLLPKPHGGMSDCM
jgi:ankyrin repeat protein